MKKKIYTKTRKLNHCRDVLIFDGIDLVMIKERFPFTRRQFTEEKYLWTTKPFVWEHFCIVFVPRELTLTGSDIVLATPRLHRNRLVKNNVMIIIIRRLKLKVLGLGRCLSVTDIQSLRNKDTSIVLHSSVLFS